MKKTLYFTFTFLVILSVSYAENNETSCGPYHNCRMDAKDVIVDILMLPFASSYITTYLLENSVTPAIRDLKQSIIESKNTALAYAQSPDTVIPVILENTMKSVELALAENPESLEVYSKLNPKEKAIFIASLANKYETEAE